MHRMSAVLVLALAASVTRADTITTFENFSLPPGSHLNNAGAAGGFSANGNFFNNSFDATYGVWAGWAISNATDTTTPGYTNQYSAVAGSGANGSATYAVAFTSGLNTDPFHPASSYINLAAGAAPTSVQVTNTTYAYLSMLNGDSFARKFASGDFLRLDVSGYTGLAGAGAKVGEVDFYLANFLDGKHTLVNTWQTLDLSALAGAKSLVFGLTSSDNNEVYGMNTPAYVAVDNLQTHAVATPEPSTLVLLVGGLLGVAGFGRRATALRAA